MIWQEFGFRPCLIWLYVHDRSGIHIAFSHSYDWWIQYNFNLSLCVIYWHVNFGWCVWARHQILCVVVITIGTPRLVGLLEWSFPPNTYLICVVCFCHSRGTRRYCSQESLFLASCPRHSLAELWLHNNIAMKFSYGIHGFVLIVGALSQVPDEGYSRNQLQPLTKFRF